MESNKSKSPFGIVIRGIGMGAADVVPGVSGGTVAFITGIYEELISSLANINFKALGVLKNDGISKFWSHINGAFFVYLFLGIGISVFSLAKLVTFLIDTYPVLIWSFFFGLVIASAWFIIKDIKKWDFKNVMGLLLGIGVAAWVSLQQTTANVEANWYILLSGMIAICAMILPGVSGAFILVLLGSYQTIMSGIKNVDLLIIAIFGLGCVIGLLAFSKLLKFLFQKYELLVLAILSGFLIGSLVKIWPWKINVGDQAIIVHSNGREEFMQSNVWPSAVNDPQIIPALALMLVGFFLVFGFSFLAPKSK